MAGFCQSGEQQYPRVEQAAITLGVKGLEINQLKGDATFGEYLADGISLAGGPVKNTNIAEGNGACSCVIKPVQTAMRGSAQLQFDLVGDEESFPFRVCTFLPMYFSRKGSAGLHRSNWQGMGIMADELFRSAKDGRSAAVVADQLMDLGLQLADKRMKPFWV